MLFLVTRLSRVLFFFSLRHIPDIIVSPHDGVEYERSWMPPKYQTGKPFKELLHIPLTQLELTLKYLEDPVIILGSPVRLLVLKDGCGGVIWLMHEY